MSTSAAVTFAQVSGHGEKKNTKRVSFGSEGLLILKVKSFHFYNPCFFFSLIAIFWAQLAFPFVASPGVSSVGFVIIAILCFIRVLRKIEDSIVNYKYFMSSKQYFLML